MTYNATYEPSDADNIVFDVLLTVLVSVGTFAALLGMGIAYNLLTGKSWNGKKR